MGLRAKVDGAAIPVSLGMVKNAQGQEVEQVEVRIHAAGQPIKGELPKAVKERLDDGEEYINSLVEEVSDEELERSEAEARFDPSEHTVEEVVEYLREADEEERVRVLDAEEEGKNRSTVLEFGG